MNKNQFKIFREAIKQTFSIKKIFEELSTLHIQEYLLLFLMTIAQVISFLFTKDASVLVLILSISSIINLVLVDRGRITNYFWGSITTTAWVIIAIHTRLIGDIASQTFYLIMQFLGIYIWGKELRATTKHEVQSKKLTTFQALIYFVGTILLYFMIVILCPASRFVFLNCSAMLSTSVRTLYITVLSSGIVIALTMPAFNLNLFA